MGCKWDGMLSHFLDSFQMQYTYFLHFGDPSVTWLLISGPPSQQQIKPSMWSTPLSTCSRREQCKWRCFCSGDDGGGGGGDDGDGGCDGDGDGGGADYISPDHACTLRPEKTVLGVPLYGRAFSLLNPNSNRWARIFKSNIILTTNIPMMEWRFSHVCIFFRMGAPARDTSFQVI